MKKFCFKIIKILRDPGLYISVEKRETRIVIVHLMFDWFFLLETAESDRQHFFQPMFSFELKLYFVLLLIFMMHCMCKWLYISLACWVNKHNRKSHNAVMCSPWSSRFTCTCIEPIPVMCGCIPRTESRTRGSSPGTAHDRPSTALPPPLYCSPLLAESCKNQMTANSTHLKVKKRRTI